MHTNKLRSQEVKWNFLLILSFSYYFSCILLPLKVFKLWVYVVINKKKKLPLQNFQQPTNKYKFSDWSWRHHHWQFWKWFSQLQVQASHWNLIVFSHQCHADSPLWWRMPACLGPWSLATRSMPCSATTVNRVLSRDAPPQYNAGPTANGTYPESPAQAVSTHVLGTLVHNHEAAQHFQVFLLLGLCFVSSAATYHKSFTLRRRNNQNNDQQTRLYHHHIHYSKSHQEHHQNQEQHQSYSVFKSLWKPHSPEQQREKRHQQVQTHNEQQIRHWLAL